MIAFALLTIPQTFDTLVGESMEITGFAFLIVAALGRVWCSIYISGRKDKVLCVDGPYQLSRNPLYFFSFLGVIGFSLALQSLIILGITSFIYLFYYRYIIRSEELRLISLFGTNYIAYCDATPRFFPALRAPNKIELYPINPKIIERALKEVVWFLFAILAIEVVEVIHAKGHLVLLTLPF
ncbi:MAG: isoprenylcysteine carboxylmethyltransferase family protein [Opitutaceae bacterium]|nr:isoprenylcysteine carboxylmethyltransferase family protein [Opitutaceae bacterium]